jgi:hypothetical protein
VGTWISVQDVWSKQASIGKACLIHMGSDRAESRTGRSIGSPVVRQCSLRGLGCPMNPDVLAPLLNASEFAYTHLNGERHIFDCTNGFHRPHNEELATTGGNVPYNLDRLP